MNLYIDIGNSAVKFAVDKEETLSLLFFLATKNLNEESLMSKLPEQVEHIYFSSVVPNISSLLKEVCLKKYNKEPILISALDDSGVNIHIDNPSELGTDLLCDLAASKKYYGSPILIIDAGTATKFLYIDDKNVFSSCAIVPGLELQLNMLSSGTALLPNTREKEVKKLLDCHNTIDVITSSSYYAHVDMINGMVERYQKEIGHPVKKVITGGNISKIKNLLNFDYDYDQLLCLKGIKVIGERRQK